MIFNDFKGKQLPFLGMGTMRLPTTSAGAIDEAKVEEMVAYAMEQGLNYFDTGWPYHSNEAEKVLGRVLSRYPRESFYLATKYPGHQINTGGYYPAEIFEEQLKKCGVDYFDFYLLHNVYEKSIDVYTDPQWGIVEYFKEQKRLGRIKHLGFSSHGQPDNLRRFLDYCGDDMEFCLIQLNYLDWTLQDAKSKLELLTERGLPVWVMEPVRGGLLANLSPEDEKELKTLRPEASTASWAFRFLQSLPNIQVVLSGMSNMEQLKDNIETFSSCKLLSPQETELLFRIAEKLKNAVPCTGCRYCCDGCPAGLDIPSLLAMYNELLLAPTVTIGMRIESLPPHQRSSACIGCGSCVQICPQNIDIPAAMKDMEDKASKLPSWAEICRQREEAAKNAKG